MFSYIKRHWPVYVIFDLDCHCVRVWSCLHRGREGLDPASAISEEVEQEQSTGADGIPESEQAIG